MPSAGGGDFGCRRISSILLARAAPVETNAAYGGCNRSRPIASAAATPSAVSASPSLSVCRRSSTYRICSPLLARHPQRVMSAGWVCTVYRPADPRASHDHPLRDIRHSRAPQRMTQATTGRRHALRRPPAGPAHRQRHSADRQPRHPQTQALRAADGSRRLRDHGPLGRRRRRARSAAVLVRRRIRPLRPGRVESAGGGVSFPRRSANRGCATWRAGTRPGSGRRPRVPRSRARRSCCSGREPLKCQCPRW